MSNEIIFKPEEAAEEISFDKGLVKCPECRKRFPVNYRKHPGRRVISCPFCRIKLYQPFMSSEWKPKGRESKSRTFTTNDLRRLLGWLF